MYSKLYTKLYSTLYCELKILIGMVLINHPRTTKENNRRYPSITLPHSQKRWRSGVLHPAAVDKKEISIPKWNHIKNYDSQDFWWSIPGLLVFWEGGGGSVVSWWTEYNDVLCVEFCLNAIVKHQSVPYATTYLLTTFEHEIVFK